MESNPVIESITALLMWERIGGHRSWPLGNSVRISISDDGEDEVVVERRSQGESTPLFRVSLSRRGNDQPKLSRNFMDVAEAVALFYDAGSAQRVGFNLGGDERAIFDRFDPSPSSSPPTPQSIVLKKLLEELAQESDRKARFYIDQAAEARREASKLP